MPARTINGMRVAMLEGKGRGVVATRDIAAGELVMATPPLALALSQVRQRPSGDEVVDQVLERRLYGSKWFSVLYDGSAKSCRAELELQPEAAPAPAFPAAAAGSSAGGPGADGSGAAQAGDAPRHSLPPEPLVASTSASAAPAPAAAAAAGAKGAKAAAGAGAPKAKGFLASRAAAKRSGGKGGKAGAGAGDAAAGGGDADGAQALPLPDRKEQTRLAKVVKYNCFGDDAEDLAACSLRQEEPRGHIGLWPEFALFNHSCAPNCVNYVVGGAMMVRAVAPIKEGEEVTICYLGRPQLLPFNRRMAALEEDYGFECSCERCTAEQVHYDKYDDVYGELYEAVDEQLGPAFLEARERGDLEAVRGVRDEVRGWLRKLYAAFRKTLLAPTYRHYVAASLYDAYDLVLQCAEVLREPDGSALHEALKAVAVVTPGSDLHVILAVRYYDHVVSEHGPDSALAGAAGGLLRRAHVARYGPVSGGLMERLVALNRELHHPGA